MALIKSHTDHTLTNNRPQTFLHTLILTLLQIFSMCYSLSTI